MKLSRALMIVMGLVIFVRGALWFYTVDRALPACAADGAVSMQVKVLSLKRRTAPQRDVLLARVRNAVGCDDLAAMKVRLSWYEPEVLLQAGAVVDLEAKLRRPWGSRNRGSFNYRLWLLGQEIGATGYVTRLASIHAHLPAQGSEHKLPVSPIPSVASGFVRALAVGDKSGVADSYWTLFRNTGTIHLMVVSGLHVGILATMCGLLVTLLLLPWAGVFRRVPRRWLVLVFSACMVMCYAWITGLQPPVLRAALMFVCLALLLISLRRLNPLTLLYWVACCSLLAFPNQWLQQGFWLSYGAVAALITYFSHRLRRPSWIAGLVACQLALFLMLLPVLGYVMGPAPVLGGLANLMVVPLVTAIVIPAAMFSAAATALGVSSTATYSAHVVGVSMNMVTEILAWFPEFNIGYFDVSQLLLGCALSLVLLAPAPVMIRLLAGLGWLATALNLPPALAPGEFLINILDVGQGSAAIVDTRDHRLVIDAGPSYGASFDAGRDVVLPVLRSSGLNRLDAVLVTHHDTDHAGGLAAITQAFPKALPRSPDLNCADGDRWSWNQVQFELHRVDAAASRNDGSCTVLIRGRSATAYFSGDIGHAAELTLLSRLPRQVDLLVVPHHGSRNSSHPGFVAKLQPTWAVVSAGRENRYQHPHATTVERYQRQRSLLVNTAEYGQLSFDSKTAQIQGQRMRLGEVYLPLVSEPH